VTSSAVFFAHSHPDEPIPGSKWQRLNVHLREAAALAEGFAREASATGGQSDFSRLPQAARCAGLVHDLGKYTPEFQHRIRGAPEGVVHSLQGAKLAAREKALDVAMVIAGHHAGIPSLVPLNETLVSTSHDPDGLWPTAIQDLPELKTTVFPCVPSELIEDWLRAEVSIRMLFSCLVDADYLNTEHHLEPPKAAQRAQIPLTPARRLETLLAEIEGLAKQCPEGTVKETRRQVLDACLAAAEQPPGFFSLTVPTGGGKTLSSMAFSLRHAEEYGLRRIVYVLPYLNIIEQNSRVLRDVLGNAPVLEHHSLADGGYGVTNDMPPETPRHALAAENWDSPLVVTTSVQFFESLFANRPAACRKLHRIPRSVVVLDECQTLPTGLLDPILTMLTELVEHYSVSVVFCTATQPAFRQRRGFDCGIPAEKVREIVTDNRTLFRVMQRTEVRWETTESTPWDRIAARMAECRQVLTIVNLRSHARELYGRMSELRPHGTFHLSTDLCPAHRLGRLDEIRRRLNEGRECRVIATQLVEAGVDIDFPAVLRAVGPLDSVAQAAGRCNREGRLVDELGQPRKGIVTVFLPENHRVPGGVYKLATDKTLALINDSISRTGTGPNLHDPAVYEDYFRRLYVDTDLDAFDLQRTRDSPRRRLDFPEVAARFKLIPANTTPVTVEYDSTARELIDRLRLAIGRLGMAPRQLMRSLQQYQVQRWPADFEADQQLGRVDPLSDNVWLWIGPYDDTLGVGITAGDRGPLSPEDLIQ